MTLTWSQVRQWRSGPVDESEAGLRSARDNLLSYADELADLGAPGRWTGQAATAARRSVRSLTDELELFTAQVGAAHRAIADTADGVLGVEQAVREAEAFAAAYRLRIGPTGTVRDPSWPTMCYATEHEEELARRERQAVVDECADRVAAAVRRAADVDADLTAVLTGILDGTVTDGSATSLAGAAAAGDAAGGLSLLEPPADGGTAAENAAWWAALSAAEQQRVIDEHPGWIGNRDGVDLDARDAANRILLPRYRTDLLGRRAELERLEQEYLEQWGQENALYLLQLSEINDKLASLDTVEAIIGQDHRQLLGLDLSHDRAQAVIADGDVMTADHVAVFTPGFTSTVQGMDGYDRDMAALNRRATWASLAAGDGDSVATVTWLGYQAPQWDTVLTGNSVASAGAAQDGGRSLAEFLRGINTARLADPDLTALGHSYGSTTTGYALQQVTGVDHVGFFGSPGIGVNHIDDLAVHTGQAFYAEAKWDGVGDLGAFGSDPSALDGMGHLETGGRTAGDGTPLTGISGHSSYLSDGSTSQYNLAEIVAGHPGEVITGNDVGITDPPSSWSWWPF